MARHFVPRGKRRATRRRRHHAIQAAPEQMAHKGQKVQFELVAVLALLALFTHNHAFWIAGLLLALLPLPDFTTPLRTIASSLEYFHPSTTAAASVFRSVTILPEITGRVEETYVGISQRVKKG
ncbi:MAG: hypothetical protein GVY09_03950, partial [Gammaproteobacteria bacterium]|nr:hypothetical protein [Gammaproteobacteria bacterium]